MIESVRNVQIFKSTELSNESYHVESEHISTSGLYMIYDQCPAAWKFREINQSSPALQFGTAAHAAMLEPDLFNEMFIRGVDRKEDNILTSDAAVKSWLKTLGIKTASKDEFSDLVKYCIDSGENFKYAKLLDLIIDGEALHSGKTVVKSDEYDDIINMRNVIFANNNNKELLTGATVEMSIMCEIMIENIWYKVKIRPDIITKDRMVPDYKTTRSVKPDDFGRIAYNNGYWFKQAFVCDVLEAVYSNKFIPALLAQGKDAPFIPQLYMMTEQQRSVGRDQYLLALKQYGICKDSDTWPSYADTPIELPTPEYIAKRYDFDDDVKITFED